MICDVSQCHFTSTPSAAPFPLLPCGQGGLQGDFRPNGYIAGRGAPRCKSTPPPPPPVFEASRECMSSTAAVRELIEPLPTRLMQEESIAMPHICIWVRIPELDSRSLLAGFCQESSAMRSSKPSFVGWGIIQRCDPPYLTGKMTKPIPPRSKH